MRLANLTAVWLGLTVSVNAAPIQFQSAPTQTALLELYTSEGCSSCPPAEAWLTQLKDHPKLWSEFVPVAFHVDYWDYLGWRDPWADKSFSQRQRALAQQWRSASIYTPGFVLNGKEWRSWTGRKDGLQFGGATAGVLTVASSDTNRWQVSFAPATTNGTDYKVNAALLAGGLRSDVKGGENRGRRLRHDFVALTLAQATLVQQGKEARGEFVLTQNPNAAGGNLALAVWITRAGRLEPVQAVGGWLRPPAK
jgi:hypothetical protein